MSSDCVFCKIVAGEIPCQKVYEDEDVLAFLDIQPINVGHALIIPKAHYNNMLETPEEVWKGLMGHARALAPAILKQVGAEACNVSTNCGRAAGQLIFHTHVHLIPRFPADGYEMWQPKEGDHPDLASLANNIREALKGT